MLALKMSPLEMCFSPKVLVMRADTVPFPDPGGPIMTARKILWRAISGRLFVKTEFFFLGRVQPDLSNETPLLDAQPRLGQSRYTFLFQDVRNVTMSGRVFCSQSRLSLDLDFYFLQSCRNRRERKRRRRRWRKRRRRKKARNAISSDEDALPWLTHYEQNVPPFTACSQTSSSLPLLTVYWGCLYCIIRLCN